MYYISPTQINVQAPNDAATGPVNVTVTNNSQTSAPFTAQLQAVAPAFFLYSNSSYALPRGIPTARGRGPTIVSAQWRQSPATF